MGGSRRDEAKERYIFVQPGDTTSIGGANNPAELKRTDNERELLYRCTAAIAHLRSITRDAFALRNRFLRRGGLPHVARVSNWVIYNRYILDFYDPLRYLLATHVDLT